MLIMLMGEKGFHFQMFVCFAFLVLNSKQKLLELITYQLYQEISQNFESFTLEM